MAIGHLGQLGCLAAFLLLRIYGLLGGKFFINKEINRREETAARARGDWVPRNEIERLQEELRREVMQGDSVAIRPVVDGKVLTEEDILAGKAGTKAQGDARAVVERRKRKEADAAAEAKKDE